MTHYGALIDSGTGAVLTISPFDTVIGVLHEFTPDSTRATHVNHPNYKRSLLHDEPFFLARARADEYPSWTWQKAARTFVKTHPDVLTPHLIARSALASAKANALTTVIRKINLARFDLRSGIEMQDLVYLRKHDEARRFKESGYDEDTAHVYPYVLQYADFMAISPKEAAEDILFKARLADDELLKTELLRLRYWKRIRESNDPVEIPAIIKDFRRDCVHSSPLDT